MPCFNQRLQDALARRGRITEITVDLCRLILLSNFDQNAPNEWPTLGNPHLATYKMRCLNSMADRVDQPLDQPKVELRPDLANLLQRLSVLSALKARCTAMESELSAEQAAELNEQERVFTCEHIMNSAHIRSNR